jgi:tripartite-type tricarboxylate transporter receptor subunit TctC
MRPTPASATRRALLGLAATVAPALAPRGAAAQGGGPAWPTRPVRLVVPYPPGGGTDILGRLVAQPLSERLGQPVVVENRGGAGGNIGAQLVAAAPADGYTLLFTGNNLAINEVLYRNPGYDSRRDFASVARVGATLILLVTRADLPTPTLAAFIEHARANPGALNHGTPGAGTAQHLAAELFNDMAGTRIVHVPYRGTGPSVAGLLSGEVQLMFASVSAVDALVREGRIRALALTSARRNQAWPDLPTIGETLPGYAAELWYGISAPARTPPGPIAAVEAAVRDVLADPAFAARLRERGFEPDFLPADGLARATEEERARWTPVLRRAGITAD